MRKILFGLVACVLAFSLVGCSGKSALSMNKKMAFADSGATVSAAFALDQVPAASFDATKVEVAAVCEQLKKFLDDGQIADLPIDAAKRKIEEFMIGKGWQAYVSLVEVVFSWVSVQHIDVDKLGQDNIVVIKEGLSGIQRQAVRAKKEWAVPFTSAAPVTADKKLKFKK